MCANELAVRVVLNFIEENLPEPDMSWPEGLFERRSYERWAAFEIVDQISSNPFDSPDAIVESFMYRMMSHSVIYDLKDETHKSYLFGLAADTSEDILRLFL